MLIQIMTNTENMGKLIILMLIIDLCFGCNLPKPIEYHRKTKCFIMKDGNGKSFIKELKISNHNLPNSIVFQVQNDNPFNKTDRICWNPKDKEYINYIGNEISTDTLDIWIKSRNFENAVSIEYLGHISLDTNIDIQYISPLLY